MFHIAIVDFTKVQCLQKLPLTQFRRSLKKFRLTLVWEILTYSSRFPSYIYSKKTRQCGREDKREGTWRLWKYFLQAYLLLVPSFSDWLPRPTTRRPRPRIDPQDQ